MQAGNTLAIYAAEEGLLHLVRALVSTADIDLGFVNSEGETATTKSIKSHNIDVLVALLKGGCEWKVGWCSFASMDL